MAIKVYEYKGCSTCQKALKFLDAKKVKYDKLPIVDQPPTKAELKAMLSHLEADGGTFKNLFNTSGLVYRELDVAGKLKAGMTASEAIDMLAKNGKLVKRPFVLGAGFGMVGFKEDAWKKRF
ncbi:MAG: Spx/MgsR family RNA polymerase-binding regulatory protein [Bdellovibrionota bacterium]